MSRLERDLPLPTPAPCAATWPPGPHPRRPTWPGRKAGCSSWPRSPRSPAPQGPGRLVPLAAARDL